MLKHRFTKGASKSILRGCFDLEEEEEAGSE